MQLAITQLENNDTITTGINIEEDMTVVGVRLRVYKHGNPDGTIGITFKDGAVTMGTASVTMDDLNAATGTYFHGYVLFETDFSGFYIRIDPTTTLKELSIEISLTGHTNDGNNYISLAKNFASDVFVSSYGTISNEDNMTTEQLTHFQPYGLELYKI
jgi:hypothetical protein